MQLQFNIYGFIVGFAIVIAGSLIERQLKKDAFLSKIFYRVSLFSLIFGVIGARIWHVLTDFHLYTGNIRAIFEVWNGGLSIFGGIVGGLLGLLIALFTLDEFASKSVSQKRKIILKLLDYSVFGLPIGQAIGRLGNYFNQELYGTPTTGFLKVFIAEQHRLPGFESVAYYHPLFFYEMVATSIFALFLYLVNTKKVLQLPQKHTDSIANLPQIGSGKLFLLYILYYSTVRFFLDFLRIDKSVVFVNLLGINQLILLGIVSLILGYSFFSLPQIKNMYKFLLPVIFLIIVGTGSYFFFRNSVVLSPIERSFADLQDRERVQIQVGEHILTVEVVNTPQSTSLGLSGRHEIGADGMLFIFPDTQKRYFWMKDMQFDIDIIWISHGMVVEINSAVPKPLPETPDYRLETYSPTQGINMVLELPAYTAQNYNINLGEVVQLVQ